MVDGRWWNGGLSLEDDPAASAGRAPAISGSTHLASAARSRVRAGLLLQKQVIDGTPVHFGLGTRTGIDVARIVWPNGIAQAEFGGGVDE